MIDKDTALGLIALLLASADAENVPYATGELKASALDAIRDVLHRTRSEIADHFDDDYRHNWYNPCSYCATGVLPDKRQSQDEQEAREKALYEEAYQRALQQAKARRALAANDEDPENPFRG